MVELKNLFLQILLNLELADSLHSRYSDLALIYNQAVDALVWISLFYSSFLSIEYYLLHLFCEKSMLLL